MKLAELTPQKVRHYGDDKEDGNDGNEFENRDGNFSGAGEVESSCLPVYTILSIILFY